MLNPNADKIEIPIIRRTNTGNLHFRIGVCILLIFLTESLFTGCDIGSGERFKASFLGLGTLSGFMASRGLGISGNGLVVVGSSFTSNTDLEAFRWTEQSGMIGLGTLPDTTGSCAEAASIDGSVIAGSSTFFDVFVAFRWTAAKGLERLTPMDEEIQANTASGISADGTVIVGGAGGALTSKAYRWTEANGLVTLGTLGGDTSCAEGVSADGNVITGSSSNEMGAVLAFRWTSETGMVALPLLTGAVESAGFGVSANGNVIVGVSIFPDENFEATLWNDTGAVGLGTLPGQTVSSALNASMDGSVVVGHSSECNGCATVAFIWDEENGMRNLRDVLVSEGLSEKLEGWALLEASAISDNGHLITGIAINPDGINEAFIATLP